MSLNFHDGQQSEYNKSVNVSSGVTGRRHGGFFRSMYVKLTQKVFDTDSG